MTPLRRGGAFRVLTERTRRRSRVLRHSGAHVLATAVRRLRPDAKIGFGPAIDDGFYYDFEVAQPFTPEDLAAFEAEMRKVVAGEVSRSCARGRRAPRRSVALRRRSAQARAPRGLRASDEVISTYTRRAVRRPVPRPARARHGAAQALQAAAHRRRVLARRLEAPDAAAHLRHGVLQEGGARRAPAPHRGGEASATTACSARSSTCSCSIRSSPGAAFWTRARHDASTTRSSSSCASGSGDDFKEIKTPLLYNKVLWETVGPLGQVPREHVPRARQRDGRARHVAQADELPVALPVLPDEAALATASCRCATSRSTCCTATS